MGYRGQGVSLFLLLHFRTSLYLPGSCMHMILWLISWLSCVQNVCISHPKILMQSVHAAEPDFHVLLSLPCRLLRTLIPAPACLSRSFTPLYRANAAEWSGAECGPTWDGGPSGPRNLVSDGDLSFPVYLM